MASAHCAAELRKRGAEGSILLVGREPEPPYERPPLSKEYLRGEAEREDAHVNPAVLVRGERGRAADRQERDVARPRGADGEDPGRGGGRLRQGADRHRGDGQHPPRRGRRERGDPLPARLRQRRRDPRRRRGGRARGPDRRQLHRLRGRRLADREGDASARSSRWRTWRSRGPSARTPAAGSSEQLEVERRRPSTAARTLEAFEGDGRVGAVLTKSGLSDRVRRGRGRRRRAARRDAGPAGRDRGRRRRHRLRLEAADLGRGHLRRRRLLLLRERRPRPRASTSSTGTWRCSRACHAAGNMLGDDADYEVVPYFFSDLADWASLEYVGPAHEWDEEVWRGDRESGEFSVWYLQGRPRRRLPQRRPLRGTGAGAADDRGANSVRLSPLF